MKKAVGFDEMRGDTISVLNSAFQQAAAVQNPPAPSFWERPQFWTIARQATRRGARDLARVVRAAADDASAHAAATDRGRLPAAVEYAAQMYPVMAGGRPMGLPVSYDDRMAAARSVAGQDPRQVAQVVRSWVSEENG